jgi:hypothetical protein
VIATAFARCSCKHEICMDLFGNRKGERELTLASLKTVEC